MATTLPRLDRLAAAKADVWRLLQQVPGPGLDAALHARLTDDADWHVSHPVERLAGPTDIAEKLYHPLSTAFPDLERRTDIFFGGRWDGPPQGGEGWWCTAAGHYLGTFRHDWLGIPATGEPATLRFGEFYRWHEGRITEARVLLDVVDLARQAGVRLLPPSRGIEILVPGPQPHDGLLLAPTDPVSGDESMRRVLAMVAGLFSFDGRNLDSMGMERFWHPNMMWYGPCGIGTSRGVGGFQRHHQGPFLRAFPDRVGAGHRARIAEGPFVASTGWPSVRATHRGEYLGVPASDRAIGMRVMDWWRRDGEWLTENWVLIDLPHLMLQMGADLMAPLRG